MEEEKISKRYVPIDVIREIFFWLPYKPFVRLRTACKQWLTATQDPQFLKKYLRRIADNPSCFIIFTSTANSCKLQMCRIGPDSYTYGDTMRFPCFYQDMLPSSHGLVCFIRSCTMVFNPTTRETIAVENSPWPYPYKSYYYGRCYTTVMGFGYHRSSNKYKVVQLLTAADNGGCTFEGFVVTVRRGSVQPWRSKGLINTSEFALKDHHAVCADGVLYFEAKKATHNDNLPILSFDLGSEESKWIISPTNLSCCALTNPGDHLQEKHLVELHGELHFVENFFNENLRLQMEIWRLADPVQEVWIQQYRLALAMNFPCFSLLPFYIGHKKILLWGDKFYSYDLQEKKLEVYRQKEDRYCSLPKDFACVHAETPTFGE